MRCKELELLTLYPGIIKVVIDGKTMSAVYQQGNGFGYLRAMISYSIESFEL